MHSSATSIKEKINAAYHAGCRRFDGALLGIGGCPFAEDQLVGNIPTEKIITILSQSGEKLSFNKSALDNSLKIAQNIFI